MQKNDHGIIAFLRLDYVHCASRLAQEKFRIKDPDYYDLESMYSTFYYKYDTLSVHVKTF